MRKYVLVIGSATLLALVVLLLTLLAEPAKTPTARGVGQVAPPGSDPATFDPGTLNTDPRQRSVRGAQGYRYSHVNERGQLIQIGGETLTPKPQGVSDVTRPWARIHLTPARILEIRAERGSFIAPDRQPRNGEFQGRVVITLFDGPPERPVNLAVDSPDVALHAFLEEARFDLELGQIESDGNVHLTSQRLDFRGKGLSLTYNELQKRIERLEVLHGQQMRLKPSALNRDEKGGDKPGKSATTRPASAANGAPQYYRGQIDQRVRVQGRGIEIEADRLRVIFALGRQGGTNRVFGAAGLLTPLSATPPASPEPAAASTMPTRPLLAASAPPMAAWLTMAQLLITQTTQAVDWPLPVDEPMTQNGPEDTIITWIGPLLVEPEENPPKDLAGPEDTLTELTGRPLRITTYKKDAPAAGNDKGPVQEIITAARFDYLAKSGRIRLEGSSGFPLLLDSIAMGGRLKGSNLVVDQVTGVGSMQGAGSLESSADPQVLPALAPDRQPADGHLPPGLKIRWSDRLDLTFYTRSERRRDDEHDDGQPEVVRLRALRHASFRGEVTVDHPQFAVRADLLALGLDDPAKGKQTLDTIHALGHVRVDGRGGGEESKLAIQSEQLDVDLVRDAKGSVQPARLVARQQVHAEQPNHSLDAGFLDVGLASAAGDAPADSGKKAGHAKVAMRTMEARENVRIQTSDPLLLTADRLVSDAQSGQVELFGSDKHPARAQRPDGSLAGEHLFFNQSAQTVRVAGPGEFSFPIKSADARSAETPPQTGGKTPGPIPDNLAVVTWQTAMDYDNLNNVANFNGAVKVRARSGREVTSMRSEELHLEFTRVAPTDAKPARAEGNAASGGLGALAQGQRAIRSVVARKEVHFEGENWVSAPGGTLLRRLTLEGPEMTFTEPQEELLVNGAGWMLMQDYRPEQTKKPPTTEPGNGMVKFTGRGETLMRWDGRLTLSANRNDMLVEDNVRMVHQGAVDRDKLQLDCRKLLAQLETSGGGGLGVWVSGKAQPTLKAIDADGSVRVLAGGRTINTDHLRYTESDQTVKLKGDAGHLVEMTEPGDPNAYTAEEFQWDLSRNRIEVIQPGPGRLPLK